MVPKPECVAMVLAGGQGKRLSVLTKNTAKPAVPFGARYRIIDFTLSNCHNSRINIVGILTQYQPLALHSHIDAIKAAGPARNGGLFLLPPFLRRDGGDWYKGTANAVFQNMGFIDQYQPEDVLILSGDHVYKMDYRPLLEYHKAQQALVTIAALEVPWSEAGRFGVMDIDDNGRIHEFEEKPSLPRSNLASMGIYVFNWQTLKCFLQADEENQLSSHDFGKDLLPRMLRAGLPMFAYRFAGYWKDVGTVESLWQAHMDLLGPFPRLELHDAKWPIFSTDSRHPPHFFAGSANINHAIVGEGCQICGQVEKSVLFPGVYVAPGAVVKNSVIMPRAQIHSSACICTSIIGHDAKIEENCEIGYPNSEGVTVVGDGVIVSLNTNKGWGI